MVRRNPTAAAIPCVLPVGAVGARVSVVRPERACRGTDRAADNRARRSAPTTAGNRANPGTHSGADQPAADIELRIGRRRREQRYGDASGCKQ